MIHKCLSIAGFDGSGGAGIQADLKTFSALGCYGMTVLTALPVQNTLGVRGCYDIPLLCIEEQLEAIFDDIIPDSIKIGMLFSKPIIELVANFLDKNAKDIPIVLDPVMVAKSGDRLLKEDAIDALKTLLLPKVTIITPNLPEAYALIGEEGSQEICAEKLLALGANAVLLKGGHEEGLESNDLFLDKNGTREWLKATRISSNNTHGTGCTLSAAICAFLAKVDFSRASHTAASFERSVLLNACIEAKSYVSDAIDASKDWNVGKGHGPLHHFCRIW